jgi:hypothetical protein
MVRIDQFWHFFGPSTRFGDRTPFFDRTHEKW